MNFDFLDCGQIPASVNISSFQGQSGVKEYHLMVHPAKYGSFEIQLEWIFQAYCNALDSLGLDMQTSLLRRFFCSDLVNQAALLQTQPFANPRNTCEPCAVSWVSQTPAAPAKVALWAYHVSDPSCKPDKIQQDTSVVFRRGELSHHWTTGITCLNGDTSYAQTRGIFEQYEMFLKAHDMALADNVMRTWFFVQDIDANYQGLVAARRGFFAQRGLTKDTHFIASTGIEGTYTDIAAKVAMDAYAIRGARREQLKFLAAPEHLSPTYIYGVTFERGTSIAYRDRKHVIISGTASINHEGKILYPGDLSRQLNRATENVEALLKQAGGTLEDMCMLIVYVRDPSDQAAVRHAMRKRFGNTPMEVVVAPVCRPGWLVEVEGKAIVPASNPQLPSF
jgi:enamine deaminase RidA (YjgF/YER057c/UK114 family)